ncbi:MAG: NYN domain-containing protein [Acidobacteriota bacterium]
MSDRAILFIDGNNWFHACKQCGLKALFALNYAAISEKLVAPRAWVGTRYYIGGLKQEHKGFREQRQFLSRIQNQDPRITVHYGRIEERPKANELAIALSSYLATATLEPPVRAELERLANEHRRVSFLKEKAADVMLAVEMYRLAVEDRYEAGYLLSADGDFTPAIEAVRNLGKKIYCASPMFSYALKNTANSFIPLAKDWFAGCFAFE